MNNRLIASGVLLNLIGALSAPAGLLVYEPFDYPPDEILTGKGGALGTTGTWSSHDTITGDGKSQDWFVHAEGTTSGVGLSGQNPSSEPSGMHRWDGTVVNLPTSGGYAGLWGADDWNDDDPNSGEPGRNLDANIALDPSVTATFQAGTTTWFSYVAVRGWDRNEETPNLIIGTDPTPDESRAASLTNSGNGIGTGGGPERNNRTHIYPMFFEEGTVHNLHGTWDGVWNSPAFTVPADSRMDWQELDEDGFFGAVNIVVGKIQWDADLGGEDIISVARFLETDQLSEDAFDALIAAQPNLSSANWDAASKPDLDQSEFDTLSIAGLKFFVDEVRIGTTFADVVSGAPEVPLQLIITSTGANLDIGWESQPGMFYVLRSNTDLQAELSTWESVEVPGSLEVDGVFQIATNAPLNQHTIERPGDPLRFYRVEEYALPPVAVLEENFDGVDPGWTTGFDVGDTAMNTTWELGDPSGGPGPLSASSGANCYGTNLTAEYGFSSNTWLRTPEIDLTTASAATLRYMEFRDIEEGFDFGTVAVLDAADDSELAVLDDAIDGNTADWEAVSEKLPAQALGKIIKIEFRFRSDDLQTFAGWYIDDVVVTTPAP